MINVSTFALSMLTSFLFAFLTAPIVVYLCHVFEFWDTPGPRKIHSSPTATMGGFSVIAGTLAGISFYVQVTGFEMPPIYISILAGCLIVSTVGFFDDIYGFKALPKMMWQYAASMIPLFLGLNAIFPYEWLSGGVPFIANLGVLCIVSTWIVGVTNAVNLSDGLDGLAPGMVTICAAVISMLAFYQGNFFATILGGSLALASLGFLPYNIHQAFVFLGDTGSLFMGYVLGILTVLSIIKENPLILFFLLPLIIGVPLFDTVLAIVRRIAKWKSVFDSDQDHIHHRLVENKFGYDKTVYFLWSIETVSGSLALYLAGLPWIYPISSMAFFCLLFLIPLSTREVFLGNHEEEKFFRKVMFPASKQRASESSPVLSGPKPISELLNSEQRYSDPEDVLRRSTEPNQKESTKDQSEKTQGS